ncbi:MAG: adenylate cyclase [Methylobacteriaceae bacterium]|nr:adenylate cyclase [Methylobacteriaceae bacterium]
MFAIAALCGVMRPRVFDDLSNFVFDTWQRIEPRAYDRDGPVRIVAIDEASLAELGQWPWPRTRLAEATRRLAELGAAAIAFDIIFNEPDRASAESVIASLSSDALREQLSANLVGAETNDQAFAKTLGDIPAVLSASLLPVSATRDLAPKAGFANAGDDPEPFVIAFDGVAGPLPILAAAAKGIGAINWLPDRDQVVRHVPLLVRLKSAIFPSLALESLRVAESATTIIVRSSNASGQTAFGQKTGINALKLGDREIQTGPNADIRPYYTTTQPDRFISFGRLLRNEVTRDEVEGRIVLIGTTATGLSDVRATPLEASVAGVEIHAQIIEALIGGAILARPDWASAVETALGLLAFMLVALLLPILPPVASVALVTVAVLLCGAASFVSFDRAKILLDPTFPSLALVGVYFAGTLALWRSDRIARQRIRLAFGKFLAPAVVERLAADPRGLVLGGETRDLTIMFSDLRNFSGLSEGLDAQELTQFMNAFLTPMTDAILDHDGTIDKYVGDAIVAFWNAPLDVADHAVKAVQATLRMRRELAAFNAAREESARERGETHVPAMIGIGLNAGPCSVGNMGSLRRFDYSVLGDTVNLAARLERVSKIYHVDIVAAESVVRRAPQFAWLELDWVRVKGRTEVTTIFGLAGDEAYAQSREFAEWRRASAEMLAAYRAGAVALAHSHARKLCGDVPSIWCALYQTMADRFQDVAPAQHDPGIPAVRVLDSL